MIVEPFLNKWWQTPITLQIFILESWTIENLHLFCCVKAAAASSRVEVAVAGVVVVVVAVTSAVVGGAARFPPKRVHIRNTCYLPRHCIQTPSLVLFLQAPREIGTSSCTWTKPQQNICHEIIGSGRQDIADSTVFTRRFTSDCFRLISTVVDDQAHQGREDDMRAERLTRVVPWAGACSSCRLRGDDLGKLRCVLWWRGSVLNPEINMFPVTICTPPFQNFAWNEKLGSRFRLRQRRLVLGRPPLCFPLGFQVPCSSLNGRPGAACPSGVGGGKTHEKPARGHLKSRVFFC